MRRFNLKSSSWATRPMMVSICPKTTFHRCFKLLGCVTGGNDGNRMSGCQKLYSIIGSKKLNVVAQNMHRSLYWDASN